jgi:hypothetical protein
VSPAARKYVSVEVLSSVTSVVPYVAVDESVTTTSGSGAV